MRRRNAILAATVAAVLGAAGVAVVLSSGAASAATLYGVAPYVDLSANSSGALDDAITQTGLKSYTAAFVIGSGCTPIWGDSLGLNSSTANAKIAKAESEGAKTIIAFGGAAGSELAQSCTDTGALANAYQSVIDTYHVDHLDFDIEGAAIADPASINRRFQAINTLERNNSGLNVSVTIPVLQSGPNANGTAFLQAAKDNGTRVDLVNIMTMDYGGAVADMGAAAISAAKGTLSAAQGVWPGFTYASLGITPMIGQNDQAGEIFTVANATSLVQFASSNGVGRLAFWSVGRDQPCPGGAGGGASPNCSSVSQGPLDFTRIFNGGNGGGTTPPSPALPQPSTPASPTASPAASASGPAVPGGGCAAPAWNPTTAYTHGQVVTMNGHQYTAQWWSQNEAPDTHSADDDPWVDDGVCAAGGAVAAPASTAPTPAPSTAGPSEAAPGAPAGTTTVAPWAAGTAYAPGDRVSYNGRDYQCLQPHTAQAGWEPPNAPAVWRPVN